MKYTVEFELQSEGDGDVSGRVYNSLVSAFDNIDKFRIAPIRTYVANVRGDKGFLWEEVSEHRIESNRR